MYRPGTERPGDMKREFLIKGKTGRTYKHIGTECKTTSPTNFYKTKESSEKTSSNEQQGSFQSPNKIQYVSAREQK